MSHLVTVKAGDTLPLFCYRIYGTSVPYAAGRAGQWSDRFPPDRAGHAAALSADSGPRRHEPGVAHRQTSRQFTFKIKANGKAIDDSYQVLSVDTWNAVNKVPRARIVLYDGDMPDGTFPVSDAATFLPGTAIEISAGYGDEPDVRSSPAS